MVTSAVQEISTHPTHTTVMLNGVLTVITIITIIIICQTHLSNQACLENAVEMVMWQV